MTWQSGGSGGGGYPGVVADGADGLAVTGRVASSSFASGIRPGSSTDVVDIEDGAGTALFDYTSVFRALTVDGQLILTFAGSVQPLILLTGIPGHNDIIMSQALAGELTINSALQLQHGLGKFGEAPQANQLAITGALSAVADPAAKAVLTSVIAALTADGGSFDNTT